MGRPEAMAGGTAAAPFSRIWKLYSPYWKRANLFPVALLAILCSASYLLGIHQNVWGTVNTSPSLRSSIPCFSSSSSSSSGYATNATSNPASLPPSPTVTTLDFAAHHAPYDGDAEETAPAVRDYPACDLRYSEYTPCEDRERSLKFPRDRLLYRERHCPKRSELLKCLIPAPHGHRYPFPWPSSRDMAWFANVPHRELAVEKAAQNWIRVEGDRFRFPGGGTMFSGGADAYIDSIARLIPLRDGSIRTAIDTGCGVSQGIPEFVPPITLTDSIPS